VLPFRCFVYHDRRPDIFRKRGDEVDFCDGPVVLQLKTLTRNGSNRWPIPRITRTCAVTSRGALPVRTRRCCETLCARGLDRRKATTHTRLGAGFGLPRVCFHVVVGVASVCDLLLRHISREYTDTHGGNAHCGDGGGNAMPSKRIGFHQSVRGIRSGSMCSAPLPVRAPSGIVARSPTRNPWPDQSQSARHGVQLS